jgi:hypothetical protein
MREQNLSASASRGRRRARCRTPTLPALAAVVALGSTHGAQALVNGSLEFEHPAVGALLVHQPGHPGGDWRTFCSAFLIHERVLLTAGHCVQFTAAQLAAGVILDARVSLQQNAFDPRTYVEGDPDASGWLEIEELVNNPDNPDWLNIPEIEANWGTWHDQGAIVLTKRVKHIEPLRVPWVPGSVGVLAAVQCGWLGEVPGFCEPLLVAYGLQEPPPTVTLNQRQSVETTYRSIDPLFIHTLGDPGDACLGDSGGAVIMKSGRKGRELVVALISSPGHFTNPLCTGETIQYRLDTKSSVLFMWNVIVDAAWGQRHKHRRFDMRRRGWRE